MASFSRLFGLKPFRGAFHVIRNLCVQQQNVNKELVNGINLIKPVWLYGQQNNLNLPASSTTFVNLPSGLIWMPPIEDPSDNLVEIDEAPMNSTIDRTKQAARLIVIRRKKMKKHKLQKLRKRMKFINAKRRQKREMRKEKEFKGELIQQCKVAESFSAEEYVNSKLQKYQEAQEFLSSKKRFNTSPTLK